MRTQLFGALVLAGCVVAAAKTPATLPGLQPDGSVLLPNQWSLRPVGRHITVGDFPVNIALHPGGAFAAVLHSGWGQHEVRILDVKAHRVVSQAAIEESFYGLAWSPDGTKLYASGAGTEVVHAFDFKAGYLSEHRELRLRAETERGIPAGLAVADDGAALYVAELWGQRVTKVSTADGRALWTRQLAPPQGGTACRMTRRALMPAPRKPRRFPTPVCPTKSAAACS
jgi:hypothetical protein